jgi:hypothetical protein
MALSSKSDLLWLEAVPPVARTLVLGGVILPHFIRIIQSGKLGKKGEGFHAIITALSLVSLADPSLTPFSASIH